MYGYVRHELTENEVYFIIAAPSSYYDGYYTLEEFTTLAAAEAKLQTIKHIFNKTGHSEYPSNVDIDKLKIFKYIIKHTYLQQI